ncbi:bis(5'-nucleosyl)-tetraphosphatase (symmetrical) YqeK [Weissella paramesenteroides]|jgi:predicted HD superfamily hydrolase involved in NAD metabolism|uniref:bis(5'-nucleosyl)-tetraphosphatase (symmetrical) n=1 Tax=Weissella paramesenteroides TaxID=1249 RepID=A0ABD4XHB9_WEIPA|nr:bis(5'-nucleosyl)-tetraphosphatase (symmetrical) YqeK [Weissella paramesenteroides]KAA8455120.1 HD domain-containing protein [Weissella paramesenteroides]KAA8457698.1 HD domain-containing protein [Weissella paramesenteroides]KAA8458297.1 HD domain-containing protein [Weissella paramesenteroides]KAA8459998.1 HD domain-containing protein [Weissella paramesenteroides]KAA8461353.1 HD domain-containing protein [Weissella paramesenteroides]
MTDKLVYTKNIYNGSREELINEVKAALSAKRFQHVLRVEKMATELADCWQVDEELASIAALTHDYAKERSDADFLAKISEKKLDPDLNNWGNNVWHGVVGAEMVKDELGIYHEDILNAIRQHTTGGSAMTKLSQILYMADYIEEARDFPGVTEVRALAFKDLGASVGWQTAHTLAYLVGKQVRIYPGTLLTYNTWSVK